MDAYVDKTDSPAAAEHRSLGVEPGRRAPLTNANICALVAANTLEFFDFFVYATFSAYIGRAFFPHLAGQGNQLLSLAVFAAGYLSRPLGGFVIGLYADRRGRKPAMLLTGSIITICTLGIAITPSYASLGIASSFIVVGCRIMQGFAIGGEMGSSSALLVEYGPAGRTGLYGGYQMAGQGAALVCAGLCGLGLVHLLEPADLAAWGWRMPWVLGAIMVPIQIYLRRSIRESIPANPAGLENHDAGGRAWWSMPTLFAIALIVGGTVPTYVVIYVITYGVSGPPPTVSASFMTTCVVGVVTLVASLLGGALADRFGKNTLLALCRVATALLVYPAFATVVAHNTHVTAMAMISLVAGASALGGGPTIVLILQKFPRIGRATGLSVSYATGVALFGGTAPLVVASMTKWTGDALASAWYVGLASLVALAGQAVALKWRNYPL
ncbi:MFS transporter [Paraburkholderia caffeinilytica]|uniref:MFS transporter n=1 Tax=Paraburkholderia caffeinilytica TaxID=1761016 RepID=UPI0038B9D766